MGAVQLMLVSSWSERESSPTRLVRCIHKQVQGLVEALGGARERLEQELERLVRKLKAVRPMHRRKSAPNAYEALLRLVPVS